MNKMIQVEVFNTKNVKISTITIEAQAHVKEIKRTLARALHLPLERISIRTSLGGENMNDDVAIEHIASTKKLYVKDLGPQIAWRTVFLLEYIGPFILYGLISLRPRLLYGEKVFDTPLSTTAKVALCFWSFHYLKRILETFYVHRFSHATMPIRNAIKNCTYYWGFSVLIAYNVNHPMYIPPSTLIQIVGSVLFVVCEIGNLKTHMLLRDLRPSGSTIRKIPLPSDCFFTRLFNFVSCPNYTYEIGAWLGFTMLTFSFPAGLFTFAGSNQMTIWAIEKHNKYKKEFSDYPKDRKAIIPFLL